MSHSQMAPPVTQGSPKPTSHTEMAALIALPFSAATFAASSAATYRRLAPARLGSVAAYPDRAQHARRWDPGCCSETTPAQPPVRSSSVETWPASQAAGWGKARKCRLPGGPRLYLCCVRGADHGQDWCRNCCYQEEVIGILTAKLQPSLALPLHQYPRRYRWT